MDTEKHPSTTLDDEVKIDQVVSNTAPRSQEQETKPAKGGGQEEIPTRFFIPSIPPLLVQSIPLFLDIDALVHGCPLR